MNKNSQILLQWKEERQTIEGFGVSEAGWSYNLWAHTKRDELMGWLFGEHGLRLNMLRGQIFPHYSPAPGQYNFDVNADVDIPFDDPIFTEVEDPNNPPADSERRGQLWVTREARKTFGVDKLIFSTWTPPAYMKSNGSAVKGVLKDEEYPNFANYLSAFCNAFKSVGLAPYAISPVNEPEYAADWNSCLWQPGANTLGRFLMDYMGPLFKNEQPDVKIYFGENGQWTTPGGDLTSLGSKGYIRHILNAYPTLNEYVQIAAGHGYPLPLPPFYPDPEIIPFDEAIEKGMDVWQTEISRPTDKGFQPSMANGLSWAARFHKYLCNANVNAFLWWAGAQPNYTSETLISIDGDRISYSFSKRYETFGHYTRYIKAGSTRVEIPTSGLPSNVNISAYKKDNEYVIVAINPTSNTVTGTLALENAVPGGTLQRIITDEDNRWLETPEVPLTGSNYELELPPKSVVTFIGEITPA